MCTQKDNTTVKIIDFGTAKELEPGTAIKVLCGTPEFVAPEVIFVQIVRLIKCIFAQIVRLIKSISQAITSLRLSDTTSYPQDQVKNVSEVNFGEDLMMVRGPFVLRILQTCFE